MNKIKQAPKPRPSGKIQIRQWTAIQQQKKKKEAVAGELPAALPFGL